MNPFHYSLHWLTPSSTKPHFVVQKYNEDSYLIYVICVCLRIVVSNTYCVVFLICFSSSCVPYVLIFSGLSILIAPSVFSNVYFHKGSVAECTFNFIVSEAKFFQHAVSFLLNPEND